MRRLLLGPVLLAAVLMAAPAIARADFGLVPGSFQVSSLDATGQPELHAGAHPDRLLTAFSFTTLPDGSADGNVKDVVIDLPKGFVGNPNAVSLCPRGDFALNQCRPESQVGIMHATFAGLGSLAFPIYNVAPRDDELAEFGFFALVFPVRMVIDAREDDFGAQFELRDLPQNVQMLRSEVELWGVPADHQSGTTTPRKPLLTNATSCESTPPTPRLHVRSWQQPGEWITATASVGGPLVDCAALPFAPSIALGLDAAMTDTPSGMSVELTLPQNDAPDGRAASQVSAVALTLPSGLTLSPGLGSGLAACDDAQLGAGSVPPSCPAASKIGSVELAVPVLQQPLRGDVFFARPTAADRFRTFVVGSGSGITFRLVGTLRPDPETGRLSVTIDGLPALPFDHLLLRFKGGPRAAITTPLRCGVGAATATVVAYRGGVPAALAAPLEFRLAPDGDGRPCTRVAPFAPKLLAGGYPARAGRSARFSMTVTRADGQQLLDHLSVTLPRGLSARIASVPRCRATDALNGSCSAASRIGAVTIEAGAGATPLPLTGDVYLTGPYGGAPFGLAMIVRALVGPLDLGTVVVRAALLLDPSTAQVTIATDQLPTIVGGIPLRLRTLALDVDRPGFMLNPTSCDRLRTDATLTSLDAASARATVPYTVGGCGRLRFAPDVAVSLGPAGELHRRGRPQLTIALRTKAGQANARSIAVRLPGALALDAGGVTELCTRRSAQAGECPVPTSVGSARVRTPLLPLPLSGAVHLVQPSSGTQPELWATVSGMGLRLQLRSRTAAVAGKPIRTTFVDLPDVPLSAFDLTLSGGPGGLMTLTQGLCRGGAPRRLAAGVTFRGHNGALRSVRVPVGLRPAC